MYIRSFFYNGRKRDVYRREGERGSGRLRESSRERGRKRLPTNLTPGQPHVTVSSKLSVMCSC